MGEFVRSTVSTLWHYRGGCLVGKVVDRYFWVIGIDALRVVDGSIFTVSPETNPQATLLMLGRKENNLLPFAFLSVMLTGEIQM
ncbi:GMC oxidoreductase [Musa troglodytarum]|uniref:GMC oxidoreductase n=1 Tax=Musa troglodytarum TaxID=320322 RepID=A0A9E7LEF1_9LILI|nr:GMC oxidoreductase [Musa troglodytarum]